MAKEQPTPQPMPVTSRPDMPTPGTDGPYFPGAILTPMQINPGRPAGGKDK